MTPTEYAAWTGRLSVCLEAVLERPGEVSTKLAAEALTEFRAADRMTSPLGDQRERATVCRYCRAECWTIDRVCRRCHVARTGQAS